MSDKHVGMIAIEVEKDLNMGQGISVQMRSPSVPDDDIISNAIYNSQGYRSGIQRLYALLDMIDPSNEEQVKKFKEGIGNYLSNGK